MLIEKCCSCGHVHESVELNKMVSMRGPWTHWYSCPTTGDPCNLVLRGEGNELGPEASTALQEAVDCDSYLIAVWWYRDGMPVMSRTTKNYPTNRFAACVQDLRDNLKEESDVSFSGSDGDVTLVRPDPAVKLFD